MQAKHNNTASSYEDAALGEYVVGRPGLIAEVTNDHGLIVGRIVAASPEGALIRADRMESDVPGYNSTADGLVGAPWHHILRRAQPPETSSHEVVTPELAEAIEKRRVWIESMDEEPAAASTVQAV